MRLSVLLAAALGASLAPGAASAQVAWDQAQRVYLVTVFDAAGVPRQLRIDPPNKVLVDVELEQIDTGGSVQYRYRVKALATSPQPLARVRIACSPQARDLAGGDWRALRQVDGQTYCSYEVNAGIGEAGDVVRFSVPRFAGTVDGAILARGGVPNPAWPADAGDPQNAALVPVVDSLLGKTETGLAAQVKSPAPKYDSLVVAETAAGLRILSDELGTICSATDWIPSAETCETLSALLPTTTDRAAIRQQLDAFIAALGAGRGTTVRQNAFTILDVLARAIRAPLSF